MSRDRGGGRREEERGREQRRRGRREEKADPTQGCGLELLNPSSPFSNGVFKYGDAERSMCAKRSHKENLVRSIRLRNAQAAIMHHK